MTETLLILWSALAVAATLLMLGMLAAAELRRRRRKSRDAVLRTKYLHIVMLALVSGEERVPRFPLLDKAGARGLLAETVAGVVGTTYGLDVAPLRRIVTHYRLDKWMLRCVRRSAGFRRAWALSLLAHLPSDGAVADRTARYARSRNPYVRFYTLMCRMSSDPTTALRLMAEFPSSFSVCEVAEIMAVLRRGMLPIAYEPLLVSSVGNLRRVGLAIVRQFGIDQAERHLVRIAAGDVLPEVGCEALYTLCSMRYPLQRREVGRRIAALGHAQRKALLRYMAAEGYAPEILGRLFDRQERPYFESLVQSYKRSLA